MKKRFTDMSPEEKREYHRAWWKAYKAKRHENHLENVALRDLSEKVKPLFKRARLRRTARTQKTKSNYEHTSIGKWRKRNPLKVKAHRIVFVAKRNGALKQLPCRKCGNPKSEAHHTDYSKPLKIVWLCKEHHAEADRRLRIRAR